MALVPYSGFCQRQKPKTWSDPKHADPKHPRGGGIVDEPALEQALRNGQIVGAALDCFDNEPLTASPRFATLDNVLLAPHALAWTDELFRDIGRTACQGMLDIAQGRRPRGIVNPEVLERPGFAARWQRLRVETLERASGTDGEIGS